MESPLTKEDLQFAHRQAITDIHFLKRQEWLISHYTVLLFAAIIFIHSNFEDQYSDLLKKLIHVIIFSYWMILAIFEFSIWKVRKRINLIERKMPVEMRELLSVRLIPCKKAFQEVGPRKKIKGSFNKAFLVYAKFINFSIRSLEVGFIPVTLFLMMAMGAVITSILIGHKMTLIQLFFPYL